MNLPMLLFMKELEKKKREEEAQRDETNKKKRKNNTYSSIQRETPDIEKSIKENIKINSFFTKLDNYISKIEKELERNEVLEITRDEIKRYGEEYFKVLVKTKNIANSLSPNIIISKESFINLDAFPTESVNHKNSDSLSWDRDYKFGTTFNGIEITKEMLLNGNNPYKKDYETWQNENIDIEKEIEQLKEEIQNKKNQKSIFRRKEREKELAKLENKLNLLEEQNRRGMDKKRKSETFENISEDDKEKIISYLDHIQTCVKYSKKYLNMILTFLYGHKNSKHYIELSNKKEMLKILKKGIEDKTFTEEEIIDIIKELDPETTNYIINYFYHFPEVTVAFCNILINDNEKEEIIKNSKKK